MANCKNILSNPYFCIFASILHPEGMIKQVTYCHDANFYLLPVCHDNVLGQQILSQQVCYIWSNHLGKLICTYFPKSYLMRKEFCPIMWLDPLFKFFTSTIL